MPWECLRHTLQLRILEFTAYVQKRCANDDLSEKHSAAKGGQVRHLAGGVEEQELRELGALRRQQSPVQRSQQRGPGAGALPRLGSLLQVCQRQLHHRVELICLLVSSRPLRSRHLFSGGE